MSRQSNNQVAVHRPPQGYEQLKQFLMRPQVLSEMGGGMRQGISALALVKQFLTLTLSDRGGPGLLACSMLSIAQGIMRAGQLGLELSGPLGHAYLVPRKGQATFQLGYKGIIVLAFRSGHVKSFAMREVQEDDYFYVQYGTEARIDHRPAEHSRNKPITHYYAVVQYKSGGHDFEVMTKEQVEAHRDKYASDKGSHSPWTTSFDSMALKTVGRKLGKRLALCPEVQAASTLDEYGEAGAPIPGPLVHLPAERTRSEEVLARLGGSEEESAPPILTEEATPPLGGSQEDLAS